MSVLVVVFGIIVRVMLILCWLVKFSRWFSVGVGFIVLLLCY